MQPGAAHAYAANKRAILWTLADGAKRAPPRCESLPARLPSVPRRIQATRAGLQGELRSTIEMAVTTACGLLSRAQAVRTSDP